MNQNVRLEVQDNVGQLTFDRAGSSANVFDQSTFEELNAALDQLEKMASLKGLLFQSAKPKVFLAGADLHGLIQKQTAAHFAFLVEQGQKTFDRIARIPFPTISLIHGVALGGGLEMALACDYRGASIDSATKIGFPEISIGLIPAWGGSTRLPRLIGLPKALEIILSARQYPARQALRLGLVDELGPVERLQQIADRLIQNSSGRKRAMKVHPANSALLRPFIKEQARRKTLAITRGNYPAPLKAIDVLCASLSLSHQESLSREKNEVIALGMGEVARNLLRIFFLQERAKKPALSESSANKKHVLVIGAGLMGAGIAQWLSTRGIRITLKDVGPAPLAAGMQAVSRLFQDGVKRGIFTEIEATESFDRIVPISSEIPLNGIDLVIEAATENLDTKRKVFALLESQVSPETVLTTNTSAICLEDLGKALKFPDRLAGLHFFNPVHRMQLVEVVYSRITTPSTLQSCLSLVKTIGKLSVVVKDSPGFLVNRILMPYLVEAVRLFNEGYRPNEIDDVMLDFGMPMGPLRLLDEVGLDIAQHVALELSSKLPHLPAIDSSIQKMIDTGWLGRKSGKGFYLYARKGRERSNPELNQSNVPVRNNPGDLRDRLTLVMVNEAARILEDGVVETPDDVDFGMIMGTGWAPFRGGPLKFADALGIGTVVSRLKSLATRLALHFAPCQLLQTMSENGQRFYPESKPEPPTIS